MVRTVLFLLAESILLASVFMCCWFLMKRAFALLGVRLRATARWSLPCLWIVLATMNFVFTRLYGANFTALYRVAGITLCLSLCLLLLCTLLRHFQLTKVEKS